MPDQKHPESVLAQRQALFIGDGSPLRSRVCAFVSAQGCKCIPAQLKEAISLLKSERFDAVVVDLAQAPASAKQTLLAINATGSSVANRLLAITGPLQAPQRYPSVPAVAGEIQLSQLWIKLQEIFSSQQSLAPPGMQIARLMFDSLRSPRTAGIRGSFTSDRHLAFHYDSATINLLIHRIEHPRRLSVVGQVLDVSMRAVHDLPVVLGTQTRTLAQTTTSQFGEFSLECEPLEVAGLQIRLAEGSWIFMSLEKIG